MARKPRQRRARRRVGNVSYFRHHGAWYVYYREGGRPIRRRVGASEVGAGQLAAQINAQLASSSPTPFSFAALSVAELRKRFLDHHEYALRSTLATVQRYRTATLHLEQYAALAGRQIMAHEVHVDDFVRHLRAIRVAPNGHPHAKRRPLRERGIAYVLATCRSLYGYAAKKKHLPPYFDNPFAGLVNRRRLAESSPRQFTFHESSECAFLRAADKWSVMVHFTLAKTGLRPGELIHLLIEDYDSDGGWLHIRNKLDLGWRVKTGCERSVPVVPALQRVLHVAIGARQAGPLLVRQLGEASMCPLWGLDRAALATRLEARRAAAEFELRRALNRVELARLAQGVWRDAGATKPERIRQSFIRTTKSIGLSHVTCPKTWRHTFATLLQEANVDPLIRQLVLGHQPGCPRMGALGMTTVYTHTSLETIQREIHRAIALWPQSLELAHNWSQGGAH